MCASICAWSGDYQYFGTEEGTEVTAGTIFVSSQSVIVNTILGIYQRFTWALNPTSGLP